VKQPAGRQVIASKRIETLFEQAEMRPSFAKRYVELARKMASRHKVRIPQKWKSRFCKSCSAFLTPGRNSIIRMRSGMQVITCLECKAIRRRLIKKVKK